MQNNIEQEILDKAAKEMATAIDWEVLATLYLQDGWHEVVVEDYTQKYRDGMADWVFTNIKGSKTGYQGRWIFKRAKDATWFRMMWA